MEADNPGKQTYSDFIVFYQDIIIVFHLIEDAVLCQYQRDSGYFQALSWFSGK